MNVGTRKCFFKWRRGGVAPVQKCPDPNEAWRHLITKSRPRTTTLPERSRRIPIALAERPLSLPRGPVVPERSKSLPRAIPERSQSPHKSPPRAFPETSQSLARALRAPCQTRACRSGKALEALWQGSVKAFERFSEGSWKALEALWEGYPRLGGAKEMCSQGSGKERMHTAQASGCVKPTRLILNEV